jgi:hypothetical protein
MSSGYNWRNTLTNFATISGTLAGFSIALIGLILGWSIADVVLFPSVTFGNVAVLLFGLTTILFIAAAEFFLYAKSFDIFDLTSEYKNWLIQASPNQDWNKIWIESSNKLRLNEDYARRCYNVASLLLFVALFFAIAPYNFVIALFISVSGFILAILQFKIK